MANSQELNIEFALEFLLSDLCYLTSVPVLFDRLMVTRMLQSFI